MKAFRARSELRQQLRKSFERMLTFYGFTISIQHEAEEQKQEDKVIKSNGHEQADDTSVTQTATTEPKDSVEDVPAPSTGDVTTEDAQASRTTEPAPAETEPTSPRSSHSQASPIEFNVIRGPNWAKASRNWCARFDHNHLRITRILRCLRVLGLQPECDAFFAALEDVFDDPAIRISNQTMMFWTRAVERPLYIAPDDDEVGWLKTWEAEQD